MPTQPGSEQDTRAHPRQPEREGEAVDDYCENSSPIRRGYLTDHWPGRSVRAAGLMHGCHGLAWPGLADVDVDGSLRQVEPAAHAQLAAWSLSQGLSDVVMWYRRPLQISGCTHVAGPIC